MTFNGIYILKWTEKTPCLLDYINNLEVPTLFCMLDCYWWLSVVGLVWSQKDAVQLPLILVSSISVWGHKFTTLYWITSTSALIRKLKHTAAAHFCKISLFEVPSLHLLCSHFDFLSDDLFFSFRPSLPIVILSLIPTPVLSFFCGTHQWMLFIPSSAHSSYSCYCQFAAGGPDMHTCEHRQLCGNLLTIQKAPFLQHLLWIPVLGEKNMNCCLRWVLETIFFQIFLHLKLVISD